MVSEISIFTLAVKNLQLKCDQCNITNSSKKGLTHTTTDHTKCHMKTHTMTMPPQELEVL